MGLPGVQAGNKGQGMTDKTAEGYDDIDEYIKLYWLVFYEELTRGQARSEQNYISLAQLKEKFWAPDLAELHERAELHLQEAVSMETMFSLLRLREQLDSGVRRRD